MNKCEQCGVYILDDTEACPLCHCVCQKEKEKADVVGYPDIRFRERKIELFFRIVLFVSIMIGALCVFLNFQLGHKVWWSVVVLGALAYLQLILFFLIQNEQAGYRRKIIIGAAGGIAYVVLVDNVFGFSHWSVNYALPSTLLVIDLMILVLMIVNKRSWQSYMLFQIFMILCSGICVALCILGQITNPVMSYAVFGLSCAIFLATYIIGGRRASNELKRRFHV